MEPNESQKLSESDQTPTANTVTDGCHPAVTDAENTAQPLANKPLTERVTRNRDSNGVSSANTKRKKRRIILPPTVTVTCGFCGNEFLAKTSRAQYCSALCRRDAWLLRNPDRAAELAESDKQRLRAHLESKGIAWVDLGNTSTDEEQ